MAKLPTIRKILKEDLKEAPDWVERMLYPLNTFMETVFYALKNDITFSENIRSAIKTFSFTTKSTYGTAPKSDNWIPIKFANPLKVTPTGVLLMRLKADDGSIITDPITIHWDFTAGELTIGYVTGLAASKKYSLTLLVI